MEKLASVIVRKTVDWKIEIINCEARKNTSKKKTSKNSVSNKNISTMPPTISDPGTLHLKPWLFHSLNLPLPWNPSKLTAISVKRTSPCLLSRLSPCLLSRLSPCLLSRLSPCLLSRLSPCLLSRLSPCLLSRLSPCLLSRLMSRRRFHQSIFSTFLPDNKSEPQEYLNAQFPCKL